jgi:HD-GYP domain-containing protein (c-di-GMP phosphodiesterase class II)
MKNPGPQKGTLGEETIRAFYRLLHTADLYEANNNALAEGTKAFAQALKSWWQENEDFSIQINRDSFFLQDTRLQYQRQNMAVIQELLRYFDKRNIQGLCFHSCAQGTSHEVLHTFARLLNRAEQNGNPPHWLAEQLKGQQLEWIEILERNEGQEEERDPEKLEIAQKTYTYALASVKEVAQKITSQQHFGVRKLKRVAQNMVDLLSEDSSVILGLSTIRDFDDYTYTHSVNVALLCMCLGKQLELSRSALCHLGVCGLVHDLGKVDIPKEILNKPGQLTSEEYETLKRHPLKGAVQITKLRASHELKTKIILSPFEHHMCYDLSGYPKVPGKKEVSLFGRILAISDVFDAMTSPRVYCSTPLSPDRALALMMEKGGKDFDPLILKVFANMLGIYPVGTVLVLDTGEKVVVKESPEGSPKSRPDVVVLEADNHGGLKRGKTVSLAEHSENGAFKRNVMKSLHPSTLNIQPAEYIL